MNETFLLLGGLTALREIPAALNPPALRAIPSVEKLLLALGPLAGLPRAAAAAVARREAAALRNEAKAGQTPDFESVLARVRIAVDDLYRARIQPVINAAGVIVHTNLGRSPLAPAAVETIASLAANYNNLEYDLDAGVRGSRAGYLEHNLALLCQAEAATAVNNCAAALVLILRALTRGKKKEVLISRGELIQIGGGFRIPEIMEASGAVLREVGTTNKTDAADYAAALGPESAMILKVHRSNFYQGGFTASPDAAALAALARKHRVPFAEDLGSGAVLPTEKQAVGLEHERTPVECLRDGADLVCFSGDKLFGGPQAGLIAGKRKLVAALKREPFYRALRCDKLILGALQTTVDLYLSQRESEIPTLAMMRVSAEELRARAEQLVMALGADAGEGAALNIRVGTGKTQIGGGAMPRSAIDSVTLDLLHHTMSADALAARLRRCAPPVIGYVSGGKCRLDLRTVFPHQDKPLLAALRTIQSEKVP